MDVFVIVLKKSVSAGHGYMEDIIQLKQDDVGEFFPWFESKELADSFISSVKRNCDLESVRLTQHK